MHRTGPVDSHLDGDPHPTSPIFRSFPLWSLFPPWNRGSSPLPPTFDSSRSLFKGRRPTTLCDSYPTDVSLFRRRMSLEGTNHDTAFLLPTPMGLFRVLCSVTSFLTGPKGCIPPPLSFPKVTYNSIPLGYSDLTNPCRFSVQTQVV